MSTYNGEKFLQQQLDSLYNQTVKVDIYVRDDGSTDNTKQILATNAQEGKLLWYNGKNLKPAKSFWNLLQTAPDADYYAFCDQDDFWFSNKIENAIHHIKAVENINRPILYCSNVTITDVNLNPIELMYKKSSVPTDLSHALINNIAPGCTMVFNRAAKNKLIIYDCEKDIIMHDWLAYKIVSMFGLVIYDVASSMYYRQHCNNVIGFHKRKNIRDITESFRRNKHVRSNEARNIMNIYGNYIDKKSYKILNTISHADKFLNRLKIFFSKKYSMNNFILTLLMKFYSLAGFI